MYGCACFCVLCVMNLELLLNFCIELFYGAAAGLHLSTCVRACVYLNLCATVVKGQCSVLCAYVHMCYYHYVCLNLCVQLVKA
jgi:hypothetical protein